MTPNPFCNLILFTELSFSVFCISSSSLPPSVSSFFVADRITSYVTANVAKHMFCKETGLAAYMSIKLVAETSSSLSCNCASCDCGLGRLTCSSFCFLSPVQLSCFSSLATLTTSALLILVLPIFAYPGILF